MTAAKHEPKVSALALLLMLFTTMHISAHHSFSAEYDQQKRVTVSGKISEVKWRNPHAWLYIERKDKNRKVIRWGFELGSPVGLVARCWTRTDLKVGDEVTVEGFGAKDGSNTANATWISLPDGRKLYAGFQETPGAPPKFCSKQPLIYGDARSTTSDETETSGDRQTARRPL